MKRFFFLFLKFFKKSPKEQRLYCEVIFWLGVSRLAILILPFKRLVSFLGQHMAESDKTLTSESQKTTRLIASRISTMSLYLPWECKCLVQAVSGKILLDKRQICSTLYIGVAKDDKGELLAHAWLRAGDTIILGGGGLERFAVVSTFT